MCNLDLDETPEMNSDASSGDKIATLTNIICRAGDEPRTKAAALLVLMAMIEKSAHPKAVASAAKSGAYICCAEADSRDIDDDAQIEMLEHRLFDGVEHLS